mmetsp:Transcript_45085/g.88224  ORF Transcript_45085/g.88224 Transcript_45085/m.88224 type:complete len:233 (+) Transcript_45085:118-816(+)
MDQERYEKKIILANDASAANNAAAPSKPVGDGGEEDTRPPNGPETIHVNAAAPTGKPTLLTATSVRILDPNGVPIYLDQPARSRRCGLATKSAVMVYAAALVLATAGILAVRLISTEQPTPEAAAVTIQMPTPLRTGDPTKIPTLFPIVLPTMTDDLILVPTMKDCSGGFVKVSNDCVPGEPHFDPEGAVCANDETRYEAYCSYGVGPNACAYCDNSALVPILPKGVINDGD